LERAQILNAFFANVSGTGLELFSRQTKQLLQTLPIVKAGDEHRSFIISTWVKSYESSCRKLALGLAGQPGLRIDHKTYRAGEAKVAERHWEKSYVVVGENDPYTIHGWVCAEQGKLWHCYIPPALRLSGCARGLVEVFAGRNYHVSKPWPNQPSGHTCSYDPWMC
jgi:hypothetical protein